MTTSILAEYTQLKRKYVGIRGGIETGFSPNIYEDLAKKMPSKEAEDTRYKKNTKILKVIASKSEKTFFFIQKHVNVPEEKKNLANRRVRNDILSDLKRISKPWSVELNDIVEFIELVNVKAK